MKRLSDLALAGTAADPSREPPETPVQGLVARGKESPERDLLVHAGALAVFSRAGALARPEKEGAPAPASPDQLPECSTRAAAVVREILAGEHLEHLPEAIDLLAAAGRRLPPSILPALLDRKDPALLPGAIVAAGERGRWLAGFRREWRWIEGAQAGDAGTDERTWNEGSLPERMAALRRTRERDPGMGRAWLAAVLPQEKAETRAELLAALAARLSAADEELLETSLDDRAVSVRRAAAELLARIESSTFAGRASARADACVQISEKGRRCKLDATPPGGWEASWGRDGIVAAPPQGLGQRAHLLIEVLTFVPPSRWETPGRSASDIAAAAGGHEWEAAIVAGLGRAALLHGATHWMGPIHRALVRVPADALPSPVRAAIAVELVGAMPGADAFEIAASALGIDAPDRALLAGLVRRRERWGERLASAFVADLESCPEGALNRLMEWMPLAAVRLPQSCFSRVLSAPEAAGTGYVPTTYNRVLGALKDGIRIRTRLHEEIAP